MCIFQSEQVIKLRFWLKITSLIFKSPDFNALDYHVRCNTEMLCTPKPTNIAELKTALLQSGMICQRSSLIRQPCDFETSILCCCSWRTFWTLSLNTTFITEAFEVLTKNVVQSWIPYLVRLTEYSGRNCMFTWKKWTLTVVSVEPHLLF